MKYITWKNKKIIDYTFINQNPVIYWKSIYEIRINSGKIWTDSYVQDY